jgi:hypothetical protein
MNRHRLLAAAFDRARTGRPALLSWVFRRVIPFNAPHGIRIASVTNGPDSTAVEVLLPWRRRNRNHIDTVHACALATAAEFATGLGLVDAAGGCPTGLGHRGAGRRYPRGCHRGGIG